MGKISVFNFITLDGYFADENGGIDWFKDFPRDKEFDEITHTAASEEGTLIFGRKTFEMMKMFWPTDMAKKLDPSMAKTMNESRKIVFSRTLKNTDWENTTILNEINPREIREIEENITLLGSGEIIREFANMDLIDEYQLAIIPKILGKGKPLFKDIKETKLKLIEAKPFKNGIVLLTYKRAD